MFLAVDGAHAVECGWNGCRFTMEDFTSPDKSFLGFHHPEVKTWIRIDSLVKEVNSPPLTLWFSTRGKDEGWPERLAKLAPGEYRAVRNLSRAYRCAPDPDLETDDRLIRVAESSGGKATVLCVMSHTKACDYLDRLVALPVHWGEIDLRYEKGIKRDQCEHS